MPRTPQHQPPKPQCERSSLTCRLSLPHLVELRIICSPLAILQHLAFPLSTDLDIRTPSGKTTGENLIPDAWGQDRLFPVLQLRPIERIRMVFSKIGYALPIPINLMHVESAPLHHSFHSNCLDSLQFLPIATMKVLGFGQPLPLPFPGRFRPESRPILPLRVPSLQRTISDGSVAH